MFVPPSVSSITNKATLSRHGQRFVPESVMVQPYKIVIYGPGDHFQPHRDTPEENLCGTFLISLFEDCKPNSVFEISEHGEHKTWHSDRGNGWCAFYPDIPHRVKPLDSGYRAILSFKLFSKEFERPVEWSTNTATKIKVDDFAKDIQNLQIPVGILCNHDYGYESKSIYGSDKLLLDAFKSKGLQVEMKPVLIRLCRNRGQSPYIMIRRDMFRVRFSQSRTRNSTMSTDVSRERKEILNSRSRMKTLCSLTVNLGDVLVCGSTKRNSPSSILGTKASHIPKEVCMFVMLRL